MASFTIGRLAAAAAVGIETVRYYQRRGLLATPPRDGGIRRYGSADLNRLQFIRSAQAAGFTLNEIGELLALDALDDRSRAQEIARQRIIALDAKIAELVEARGALLELAERCAAGPAGPCPIIAAFNRRTHPDEVLT